MKVVFVTGVNLGRRAIQGIIDSEPIRNGKAELCAIFSLDEEREKHTVGFEAFDDLARDHGIPLHKVRKICSSGNITLLKNYEPDLICVIGWSELVNSEILDMPRTIRGENERHGKGYGCIGMHPTKLPDGRGRAPIPWAIIKGLEHSAVSMFYLEEEADVGDIIAQREFEIGFDDNAQAIYNKVAELHYQIMVDTFPALVAGSAACISQAELAKMRGVEPSYWHKRCPEDGIIDWEKSAIEEHNWVRALTHPYPGAFTYYGSEKILIWEALPIQSDDKLGEPGQILGIDDNALLVACKTGAIRILTAQIGEGEKVTGKQLAFQRKLVLGNKFGAL